MKNYYYALWIDVILQFKKRNPKGNWKLTSFFFITVINGLNLLIILLWMKLLNIVQMNAVIEVVKTNSLLKSPIIFYSILCLPFAIVNYFLIFHKDRFEKLIIKYPIPDKRYGGYYVVTILLVFLVTALYMTSF